MSVLLWFRFSCAIQLQRASQEISISTIFCPLRFRQHPQGKLYKTIHAHYITAVQTNKNCVKEHELKANIKRDNCLPNKPTWNWFHSATVAVIRQPLGHRHLFDGFQSTKPSVDLRLVVFAMAARISPVRPFPPNTCRINDGDLQRDATFPLRNPLFYPAQSRTLAAPASINPSPPLAGHRCARQESEVLQIRRLTRSAHSARPPFKNCCGRPSGLKIRDYSDLLSIVADSQIHQNYIIIFLNHSQTPQIWPNGAQCFDFGRCWEPFRVLFSIKLCDLLNLLSCNRYQAIFCFYFSGPHLYASKLHHIVMLFLAPFLVATFPIIYVDFLRKCSIFGTPWKSSGIRSGFPKRKSGAKVLNKYCTWCSLVPTSETLKHREMLGGLDLIFAYAFRC